MRRGPRFKKLLEAAERRTRMISFEDLSNGRVEVMWLSRHGQLMWSVEKFIADKPEFGLLFIIAVEDQRTLARDHGDACPCEDCCVARVDRELSEKRLT